MTFCRRSAVLLRASYPQLTRLIREKRIDMLHYLAEMFHFRVKVVTVRRLSSVDEKYVLVKLKKADTNQVNEDNIEELLANAREAVARGNAVLTIEEARAETYINK